MHAIRNCDITRLFAGFPDLRRIGQADFRGEHRQLLGRMHPDVGVIASGYEFCRILPRSRADIKKPFFSLVKVIRTREGNKTAKPLYFILEGSCRAFSWWTTIGWFARRSEPGLRQQAMKSSLLMALSPV